MKKLLFKLLFLFAILTFAFVSCNDEETEEEETLYVKFGNEFASEYTITGIRLLVMGEAGVHEEPDGEFGGNILKNGATIAPGEVKFFTLKIPNLHYAYYRLTVDDGDGTQIYLYDQEGYSSSWDGPITHWGSDERTVSVNVGYSSSSGLIIIKGWSDMAGID